MAELTHDDVLLVDLEVPDEPVPLIWLRDPAIDQAALTDEIRAAYTQTRDIGVVPIKPGKRPARFMVRVPDPGALDSCATAALARAEVDSLAALPAGGVGNVSSLAIISHFNLLAFERFVTKAVGVVRRKTDGTIVREDVTDRDELRALPRELRKEIGSMARKLTESPNNPPPEADTGKSALPS